MAKPARNMLGVRTWAHADALGTPRLIRTTDGVIVDAPRTDAWGRPLHGTEPQPFGFTGELQDPASDLVYLRARWYNPTSGTFLSRDPFAGYPNQPYSLHPYQYAYSQPTTLTDPSGEFACLSTGMNGATTTNPYGLFCTNSARTANAIINGMGQTDSLGTLIHLFGHHEFPGGSSKLALQNRRTGLSPAAERLEFILDLLTNTYGLPFKGGFTESSGFAADFQDPWPSSSNQVGHFMTAVGLAYDPEYYVGGLTQSLLGFYGVTIQSPEDAALRLIVGHEKISDQYSWNPVETAAVQYLAATDYDIALFLQAVELDRVGDSQGRDALSMCIVRLPIATESTIEDIYRTNRVGNSVEDMRLSIKGYIFGLEIKQWRIASLESAARWLVHHIR